MLSKSAEQVLVKILKAVANTSNMLNNTYN